MTKFLSLLKLQFTQQFRGLPVKGKKKGGVIAAFIVLGLCFLPIIVSIVASMYFLGTIAGNNAGVLSFLILICQGLVLVFGLFTIISQVYNCKDADKLLYLPVKPITIFLVKLGVAYLNEVLTTAATIIVVLLPFGFGAQLGITFYLMLIPALLIIPMLPLLVGCIVALPFSLLINAVGNKGPAKTILQLLFFVAFMFGYMMLMQGVGGTESDDSFVDIENIQQVLYPLLQQLGQKMVYVHPNFMLATALCATTFPSWATGTALTIGENALLLGIVVLFTLPVYNKMLHSTLENTSSKSKKLFSKDSVQHLGTLRTLMLTDIKNVFRNSQMGFQCLGTLIVMPLLVAILAISFGQEVDGVSLIDTLKAMPEYIAIAPVFLVLYLTLIGVSSNILGLYPISRENNNFFILKSIPVPFEKILTAKVLVSTCAMLIADVITAVLAIVLLGIPWYSSVFILVILAFAGFGSMCITTKLDVKQPKLGWSNFNQSLKNAKNSWIAMLIGLIATIVIGAPMVLLCIAYTATNYNLFVYLALWIVPTIITFLYAWLAYKWMNKDIKKYFDCIEV
ncbi:MAG: hypothetical protein IKD26_03435 [Clostridia bacterium]|nr:hypothetical protein [Clostridia bacterium]